MSGLTDEADPIEAVLAAHYLVGSWAPRGGCPGTPGRWECSCGASGDVPNGRFVVSLHRAHVAAAIRAALDGGR